MAGIQDNFNDQPKIGLSCAVDVFDDSALFESLDNARVLELSNLRDSGFSSLRAIEKSTGIVRRRILRQGLTAVDLGVALCEKLERVSKTALSDFDHIILCHSHVDARECHRLAAILSGYFGLASDQVSPGNLGCAGFLKMLTEGSLVLRESDPGARVALLSIETPEFWHDAADRLFCGIVSTGATAVVLSDDGLPLHSIRSGDFEIPEDRRPNPDALFNKEDCECFDFRGEPTVRTVMRMNPEPVFLNGIELMLDHLRTALRAIDYRSNRTIVVPHQPSGKLLRALRATIANEFPEIETLNNLTEFGNTISSSVPTILSRLDQVVEDNKLSPLQVGDQIVLLAAGICMNDIADSMSAGHAVMTWSPQMLDRLPSQNAVVSLSK